MYVYTKVECWFWHVAYWWQPKKFVPARPWAEDLSPDFGSQVALGAIISNLLQVVLDNLELSINQMDGLSIIAGIIPVWGIVPVLSDCGPVFGFACNHSVTVDHSDHSDLILLAFVQRCFI